MTMHPHDPIQDLKRARHIVPSVAEKARVRAALEEHLEAEPVRTGAPARLWSGATRLFTPSPYQFIFNRPMSAIIALLTLALVGGGTSYAAQGALPGDALYTIKTHVNEPVEEALAFSPQAQASVQAQLAATRLSEAQQLAADGRLSTTTAAMLAANFANHAQEASAKASILAKTNPASAAEIDASLAARIAADKNILQAFENANASDTPAVTGIIASLTAHLDGHDGGALMASSTVAAHLSTQAFTALQNRAQQYLTNAQQSSAQATAYASTTVAAQPFALAAQKAVALAALKFSTATSSRAASSTEAAYVNFLASISASTQATAYAHAALRVTQHSAKPEATHAHEHTDAYATTTIHDASPFIEASTTASSTEERVRGGFMEHVHEQASSTDHTSMQASTSIDTKASISMPHEEVHGNLNTDTHVGGDLHL